MLKGLLTLVLSSHMQPAHGVSRPSADVQASEVVEIDGL